MVRAPAEHILMPDLRERVRNLVTAPRFEHIQRVVALTDCIARCNRFTAEEREDALLAALLHDAARDLTPARLFELAPPRSDLERAQPLAVHGRASRALARSWGVENEGVLDAIEGHVFGVALGDRVGMAVYVADVCEPGRGVNHEIRERALGDLPGAYRAAVDSKVSYLLSKGKSVHPTTLEVYEQIHNA